MAIAIRQCSDIKGIILPDACKTEVKISQLADDTTIFIRDTKSVREVMRIICNFGKIAGPKLNENKINTIICCPYVKTLVILRALYAICRLQVQVPPL